MDTNIDKKEIEHLVIGLDMLADKQHEYINAIGDIAIVMYANALDPDQLKQPTNPNSVNELLSDLHYFLNALSIKNSRLVQTQIENLITELQPVPENYQAKYEQLLIKHNNLQNELLSLKEMQIN